MAKNRKAQTLARKTRHYKGTSTSSASQMPTTGASLYTHVMVPDPKNPFKRIRMTRSEYYGPNSQG